MNDSRERAPDFELPGTDGSGVRQYRLSDHTRDGSVLLAFYIFDFHPACTTEMCSLRDLEWFDLMDDVTIFGISTDRAFSHRAFASETT